jgi:hypothetical protein
MAKQISFSKFHFDHVKKNSAAVEAKALYCADLYKRNEKFSQGGQLHLFLQVDDIACAPCTFKFARLIKCEETHLRC